VNRISLGVQSFNDAALKALGRIHAAGEAVHAAELAARFVGNFNIDLMYALPEQTVALALDDIRQAVALAPTHLSAYQLTLEPNTLFHRYPPALPDEDAQIDIEEAVHAAIAQAGYARYETSAFALPGRQARHNLNYWRFGDYVGIGAGAHGKISLPDKVLRQIRFKQPKAYLAAVAQGNPVQEEREVGLNEMPFEFMLNALRLVDGFELASYAERTGDSLASVLAALDTAQARGLIERDAHWVTPTPLGRRFLNDLQALFLAS
jgi:putative oxygen-independent coproporphyrinogen III oxidase